MASVEVLRVNVSQRWQKRAGNGDRAGRAARLLLLLLLLLVKNGARVSADWTDRQTVSVERCDEAGRHAGPRTVASH